MNPKAFEDGVRVSIYIYKVENELDGQEAPQIFATKQSTMNFEWLTRNWFRETRSMAWDTHLDWLTLGINWDKQEAWHEMRYAVENFSLVNYSLT